MKSKSLFYTICVTVIPITAGLLLSIFFVSQYVVKSAAEQRLTFQLQHNVMGAQAALENRQVWISSILDSLARNDMIINAIVDSLERDSYIIPFFRSYQIPSFPAARVSLLDYKGRVIASNSRVKSYEGHSWIEGVLQGAAFGRITEEGMIVATPVRYSGLPEGVIVMELPKERLSEFFSPALKNDTTIVTDAKRTVVFSSLPETDLRGVKFSPTDFDSWEFSENLSVDALGLNIYSAVSRSEIFSGHTHLKNSLQVIILLCLATVVAAIFLTAKITTYPLEQFLDNLNQKKKLPEVGPGEFIRLAKAYNTIHEERRMGQQALEQLNQELEEKVALRTEELAQSNRELQKLAQIAETTDNAVVLTDRQGYIEWVNAGFYRITGYEFDEAIGKKPGDLLQGPDTDPEVVAYMRACISREEDFHAQLVNYTKTGSAYWLDLSVQAMRNEQGEVTHFMAIQSDVTALKNKENQLQDSLDSQRILNRILALSLSTEPLHEKLENSLGIILNSHRLSLKDSGALVLFNKENIDEIDCYIDTGVQDQHKTKTEIIAFAKGGEKQSFENGQYRGAIVNDQHILAVLQLQLEKDQTLSALDRTFLEAIASTLASLVLRDRMIQDLTVARAIAEEATRAKSDFLACMSHELRTPMNSILGFTRRLLKTLSDSLSERDRDALETVQRNGQHLLTLINDILDLSKIEAGKMETLKSTFDVVALAKDVANSLRPLAEQKEIAYEVHLPDEPVSYFADQTKIKQIFLNVASNAIKYTDTGGVVIRLIKQPCGNDEPGILFQVEDTGVGISERDKQRLFAKFTQLSKDESSRKGGTGLGLVITKEYVDMHGGTIEVDSEQGVGSKFSIFLPLVARNEEGCSNQAIEIQSDL